LLRLFSFWGAGGQDIQAIQGRRLGLAAMWEPMIKPSVCFFSGVGLLEGLLVKLG